ncbi:MAG: hypothetical protein HYZ34_03795, partial [Ignavibacteriae bacterium]|nr:hypothetical protein [Ignavibacteriota bacterium]
MKHILLILFVLLPWTLGFVVAQTLHDNVWVTNGPVNSIAHSDHSIYLGGYFTEVGPATGSFVSVNAVTGSRDTDFPKVIGTVTTTVSDGLGGWYIGGYFTRVGNYARTNLAHIKADKTVDEDFNISFSGYSYIYALAVSQTTLYVGGYFTSIGGVSRSHLASIDLTLGTVTSWEPNPNSQVLSLLVDGVYSRLYVGGYFITISGSTRNRFASYNIWDGSLNSINPNLNSAVFAMALSVTGD